MDVCIYSKEDREESDYVHKFLYERKMNTESDIESKDYEKVIDYITKIENKYVLGVELNVKLVELLDDLKNKFNK